jgi:acetyl esterase/lipase
MQRRHFLISVGGAALLPAAATPASPATVVYKTAGGCEIKADLLFASSSSAAAGARKPVAVHIHGGALIMGSRRVSPTSRLMRALDDAGFAVVSIDYRLAPETKLPDIIADVRDAFQWIRKKGPAEFAIDPKRIVVCGGSAGGYLTLMTGFCVKPRPRALVSYWGYGDIVGDWYSKPDPFYSKQPAVKREDALAAVGSTPVTEPAPRTNRGRFYLYCRQQGLWPREVAGHDPVAGDRWFTPYCPIRNVTRKYPPTMLVHGTADTDVPYQQSKMMAARFAEVGVEHQFITVPEGAHGIGNIPPADQERIYRDAAKFLAARA